MNTEEISKMRYSFKHTLLRNVLIRIDYTGITNIDNWVESFQTVMKEYFSIYNRGIQNNARVNLTSLEEIANNLSIPIEEIRKETIHEFSSWKKDANDVTLSISPFFMTINVRCKEYSNIDAFLELTKIFLGKMYESNPFFDVHRIGIRKINGKVFDTVDEILKIYKKQLFFGKEVDEQKSKPLQREYSYRYVLKDSTIKVNYSRQYRLAKSFDGKEKHQVLLDIDTYVDKFNIDKCNYNLKDNCIEVLQTINNHQFEIFAESVEDDYLQNKVVPK